MNRTDFISLVGMFFEVCAGRKPYADETYFDSDDFRFSNNIGICEDGESISLIFSDAESGIEVKGCGADITGAMAELKGKLVTELKLCQ